MIHSIFRYVLLFLLAFSVVPAGAEINPPNPPEPPAGIVSYPLTVTCSPANAAYCSGSGRYTVGQKVWINTSAKAGYVFDHWTLNGQPYDASGMRFEFTTLGARTQLVAHYRYEPANPAEPMPNNQVRLFLSTSPDGVASFNRTSGERVLVGTELDLYVYPNQGYKFQGWYAGGTLIGESQSLHYTMPADVTTLVAKFVYNPDVPIEPVSPGQTDIDLTPDDGYLGDVNGDDKVDLLDLRYLVKIVFGQQDEIEAADINGNYNINIGDVAALIDILDKMGATQKLVSDKVAELRAIAAELSAHYRGFADELSAVADSYADFDNPNEKQAQLAVSDMDGALGVALAGRESAIEFESLLEQILQIITDEGNTDLQPLYDRMHAYADGGFLPSADTSATATLKTASDEVKAAIKSASPYALPEVPFEFCYNASFYDEASHSIANHPDAALPDAALNIIGSNYTFSDGDHISITGRTQGHLSTFNNLTAAGSHFARRGNDGMTIVCKVAPRLNSGSTCDFVCNRGGNYNYMLRIGDNNTIFLHTSYGFSSNRAMPLRSSDAQTFAVRVDGSNNVIRIDNYTTGETFSVSDIRWGGTPSDFKLFYNDGGEYFTGDFFWVYYSFDTLTDEEVESVVRYNESVAGK